MGDPDQAVDERLDALPEGVRGDLKKVSFTANGWSACVIHSARAKRRPLESPAGPPGSPFAAIRYGFKPAVSTVGTPGRTRGIVATPANFGKTGLPPSHPELLDWLATELVRDNWRLKSIHRLIPHSSAFRQTSRIAPGVEKKDPENVLLSRMPPRRMDADSLYDFVLKVTGQLDSTSFGTPSPIEVKPDGEVVPKGPARGYRRALYVLQRRRTPVTMLETFDTPPLTPNCIERPRSVVATQAPQLMNSAAMMENARQLAGRREVTMVRAGSRRGWRAVGSRAAKRTARPTTWATKRSRTG